jgi:hypothetical protein
MARQLMDDEVVRIWKEAGVAYFQVPSLQWPGGNEENRGNDQANQCLDRNSNRTPIEALPPEPASLVMK